MGSVRLVTMWVGPGQFHDAAGVGDWRVLAPSVAAHFRTGGFAVGVVLVDAIAALGEMGSAAPEIDLRRGGVTVRLVGDIEQGLGTGRRCGSSSWTRRGRSATGRTWTSSSHPTKPRAGWRPRSPPADV